MFRVEFSKIFDYLIINEEIKTPLSIRSWMQKCDVDINATILEIDSLIKMAEKDRFNKLLPFYLILLAYANHLIPNWAKAIGYAKRAETVFEVNGQEQNRALSLWVISLLLCGYENLKEAHVKKDEAISIILSLFNETYRLGEYRNVKTAYLYQDVINDINNTISATETRVLKQLESKQTVPILHFDFFARLIALILVPSDKDFEKVAKWKSDIAVLEPSEIGNLGVLWNDMHQSLVQSINPHEQALIYILLSHSKNLVYYATGKRKNEQTEDLIREAMSLLDPQHVNHSLCGCYLNFLYYNINTEGRGRSFLENANRALETIKGSYTHVFIAFNEVKNLQNDIQNWVFPFSSFEKEIRRRKLPTTHLIKLIDLIKKWTGMSPPERTEYKKTNKQSSTSGSQPGNSDMRNENSPPPPFNPQSIHENDHSHIKRIVIPIDTQALGVTSTDESPVSHEIFEKLEIFNEMEANENDGEG